MMDIELLKQCLLQQVEDSNNRWIGYPNTANWDFHIGVLLSTDQAQLIINLIQENEALKFQIQQFNIAKDQMKFTDQG